MEAAPDMMLLLLVLPCDARFWDGLLDLVCNDPGTSCSPSKGREKRHRQGFSGQDDWDAAGTYLSMPTYNSIQGLQLVWRHLFGL